MAPSSSTHTAIGPKVVRWHGHQLRSLGELAWNCQYEQACLKAIVSIYEPNVDGQYVGVCGTVVLGLCACSGYSFELIVPKTVPCQGFQKPLKRFMNALKRCEGWCVKGTRHQAAKTATASSTIDTLFRKTIQLQGKPMMKAMLVQRIRQPKSACGISNSFNGKLLCFEGLWFWETKLRKGIELP